MKTMRAIFIALGVPIPAVLLGILFRPSFGALVAPVFVIILVFVAMIDKNPEDTDDSLSLPVLPELNSEQHQMLLSSYDKTVQMHVETDKGMYQIVGIFVPASLLILGWAVTQHLGPDLLLLVGSIAVVLVGVATLMKHRLRWYNKIREIYCRKIEAQLLAASRDEESPRDMLNDFASKDVTWGLHTFMQRAASRKESCFQKATKISFHEAVDAYFFVYILTWGLIVWLSLAAKACPDVS
jgi:hypothetical protein